MTGSIASSKDASIHHVATQAHRIADRTVGTVDAPGEASIGLDAALASARTLRRPKAEPARLLPTRPKRGRQRQASKPLATLDAIETGQVCVRPRATRLLNPAARIDLARRKTASQR